MIRERNCVYAGLAALPFVLFSIALKGNSSGADPRHTGAPGDQTCAECHLGSAVNSSNGSVKITLAGAATYTPGVKQRVKVEVADTGMRRWGFQLSARVNSKPDSAQAGTLASVDNFAQILCDNFDPAPCPNASMLQFATHTTAGTRNGTTGGVAFEIDWTPPATDVGPVTLYAAGNAANGNGNNGGDRIYTTKVELAPAALSPKPSITSVVNLASLKDRVGSNTWIAINGTALAGTTSAWTADALASGRLPQALEQVNVTVNNKPAYVQSVSPTKIIALTPADDSVGPVEVRVSANGVSSDAMTVQLQNYAPALFLYDGTNKIAFNRPDEPALDKAAPFPAAPKDAKTAKPGETIILFATGLGATDPETPAGQLTDGDAALAKAVSVTIGGVDAQVVKTGLIAGLPRVYEVRVTVPDSLADGDQPVIAQIEGVASRSGDDCCVLSIAK